MLHRTTSYLKLSIIFAALSSVALVLVPFRNSLGEEQQKGFSVFIAIMFWGSLILEQYFFWISNTGRKKIQSRAFGGRKIVKSSVGIITFGSNKEARASDLSFIIAVVIMFLLIMFQIQNNWAVMIALAVLLLSFNLHCIFNGTTYRYIKAFHKIKKEPKRHENTRNIH